MWKIMEKLFQLNLRLPATSKNVLIWPSRNTMTETEAWAATANQFWAFHQISLDFAICRTQELNPDVTGIIIPTSQAYQCDLFERIFSHLFGSRTLNPQCFHWLLPSTISPFPSEWWIHYVVSVTFFSKPSTHSRAGTTKGVWGVPVVVSNGPTIPGPADLPVHWASANRTQRPGCSGPQRSFAQTARPVVLVSVLGLRSFTVRVLGKQVARFVSWSYVL